MGDDKSGHFEGLEIETGHCDLHGTFEVGKMFDGRRNSCGQCARDKLYAEMHGRRMSPEARMAAVIENMGVAPIFAKATLSEFDLRVQKAARTWVSNIANGWSVLFVIGPPGTGKSHLTAAMSIEAIKANVSTQIVTHSNLVRQIRQAWDERNFSQESVLRKYEDATLLILDDVGSAASSEHDALMLGGLIDNRYTRGRPMVITSNLDTPALLKLVGDRAGDRLRQNGTVLVLNGKSRRLSAEEQAAQAAAARKEKPL